MSQEFMKNYKQHEVNLQHEQDVDEVYVCESWIVEDPYRDKANALGFNVPKNTWMVGMKVNNIDTWERVKSGELKGFSVESAIHLEEFNKVENNDNMEVENETFWAKLKNVLFEALGKNEEEVVEELTQKGIPCEETKREYLIEDIEYFVYSESEIDAFKEDTENKIEAVENEDEDDTQLYKAIEQLKKSS